MTEKTTEELISTLTWYDGVDKLKEILGRLNQNTSLEQNLKIEKEGALVSDSVKTINFIGEVTATEGLDGLVDVVINSEGEVNTINSITTDEPTGSDQVLNVVSLTQAEYDSGTRIPTTLYIITD